MKGSSWPDRVELILLIFGVLMAVVVGLAVVLVKAHELGAAHERAVTACHARAARPTTTGPTVSGAYSTWVRRERQV